MTFKQDDTPTKRDEDARDEVQPSLIVVLSPARW